MRDPLGQLRLRFAGLRLVTSGARAEVYAGSDFTGRSVSVVVLTESASADREVREVCRGALAALEPQLSAFDPYVERPWAAFHDDPETVIGRVFAALGEPVPTPRQGPEAAPVAKAAPEVEAVSVAEAVPVAELAPEAGAGTGPEGETGPVPPPPGGSSHPPVPPPPGGTAHPPVPPPPGGFRHLPVPPPPGAPTPTRPPVTVPAPPVALRPDAGRPAPSTPARPPEVKASPRLVAAIVLGVLLTFCVCTLINSIGG